MRDQIVNDHCRCHPGSRADQLQGRPGMTMAAATGLLSFALIAATPAAAAGKSLILSDGVCEYRLAVDPATDRARLKDTFEALTGSDAPLELGPPLNEPGDLAGIDVTQYHADCAAHRARLAKSQFIDLPGIEDLRTREIAELDDVCAMTEAKLKAATGDTKALGAYAPAGHACAKFADALDVAADKLKTRYDDLLTDLCHTSTERNVCMDHFQKQGEGPNKIAQIRLAILTQGWAECAGAHLAETGSGSDQLKQELKDALLKRLKAKMLTCAQ